MQKLSREFVTVAEEVHFLYPENKWALDRAKKDPRHVFFKKFGEQVPERDWNHPGTKQGVYMIGPNAEYLDGAGAISGNAGKVTRRLKAALERWKKLRRSKKYRNKPVPVVGSVAPPGIDGKPLVLQVYLRDLPRAARDKSGRRFTANDYRGMWLDFTKWAWNQNWIAFDDPKAFVTNSKKPVPVDDKVFRKLCRDVLVDNVRGQTGRWKHDQVKVAKLTMRRIATNNGKWSIEYTGEARMNNGAAGFEPKLHGRAVWDPKRKRFEQLDLVAIGTRRGAGRFNQRSRDKGAAPMGIALGLHR